MIEMNFPRISIVVPSFNQGEFLEETLNSIFDQQYQNVEVLVVDGGSSDNSVEIIKKYESQITWWVSEKDKGQSDAITKGFRKATGEIITWLNSDDLLMPGTLNAVARYFGEQQEAGLIYGGIITFRDNVELSRDWGYDNPSIERNLSGMAFSQPSAFYRKQYLDRVGCWLREDLHYGMDYDLFSRLALVCRFIPVPEIFAKYRLHGQSKTISQESGFIRDWSRVFVNLCKNFGWSELLDEMKRLNVFGDVLDYDYKYAFEPDPELIKGLDKKRMLFYHLCYVLKAFYWTRRIRESRRVASYLVKNYPLALLLKEKAVKPILIKIMVPRFIMNTARDIRRKIRKLRSR